MINRSSHKIPERHKKHSPAKGSADSLGFVKVGWLPDDTADFVAWGIASERARLELHAASRNRGLSDGPAQRARELFLYTLERAYPSGFWEGMPDLYEGKTDNLEIYLTFLEADPRFYRSGYAKSDVIRGVKRVQLTPRQRRRLQDVVLKDVDEGFRREFRDYCRLARHVQTPDWLLEMEERIISFNQGRATRAKWIMEACAKT
jgi:hypothetical protein